MLDPIDDQLTSNISADIHAGQYLDASIVPHMVPTMDRGIYESVMTLIGYFCIAVGIPGIVANILIIITYTKIGITNSINTSYTAMAVSDIGCIVTTMCFEYLTIPHIEKSGILPIIGLELIYIVGYPNLAFTKITSCITAYISLERCLCVTSPHKVKLLFTKKLTSVVLVIIFIICSLPAAMASLIYKAQWKISPHNPNKTVLGFMTFHREESIPVNEFTHFMYGIILHFAPLILTLFCSVYLIVHLNAGSKFRLQNAHTVADGNKTNERKSNREDRIVKAVLIIAVLFIVLSTPLTVNFVLNLLDPRWMPFSSPTLLMNDIRGSFATTLYMLNSCFNILIYYKLGSKFRTTFREITCFTAGLENSAEFSQ